jgi:lactate dehydrogenase-like 2-hydroxyacid dehydrogenase
VPKPDILVVWTTRPTKLAEIEGEFQLHRYDHADDPAALLAEVGPRIRGVATTGGKGLTRSMIERMPNLEIVASSGVGYDKIDVDACTEHGIVVTNTPDVLTDDVADTAMGLIISARRNVVAGDAYVRSGAWGREGPLPLTSALRGKRVGIVGLGRIGGAIARRCEPFGVEIGYTARRERDGVDYRCLPSVQALAEWSDILVVAVPGGDDTDGLIDAEVLDALGPEGTLINIARGSVVDEPALVEALRSGGLGSAGLDVFRNEPTPDPALTSLPNVVLYPHHASGTVETRDAMAALVNDNLRAFFAGRPALTPVNELNKAVVAGQ